VADNKQEVKDFDLALEEAEEKKIVVKMAGVVYTFPHALPARTVLAQMRWMDETGSMPTQAIPEWLASIVGQDKLDEMLDNGATWNQLEDLLGYLLEKYNLTQEDAESEVEVESDEEDGSPK
jgi:hypothetical protein|tara:strand:- start:686 stop:1051 length:366 start_codon:yes stop_codon:yes gene_type:complete